MSVDACLRLLVTIECRSLGISLCHVLRLTGNKRERTRLGQAAVVHQNELGRK